MQIDDTINHYCSKPRGSSRTFNLTKTANPKWKDHWIPEKPIGWSISSEMQQTFSLWLRKHYNICLNNTELCTISSYRAKFHWQITPTINIEFILHLTGQIIPTLTISNDAGKQRHISLPEGWIKE